MGFTPVTVENVQIFLCMFARTIAMVSLLPVFGSSNVPMIVKAAFSLLFTLVLFPIVPVPAAAVHGLPLSQFVLTVLKELCIGLTVGFAASFLFAAVQFAGSLIDNQIGFTMIELYDPFTDILTTVSGQFKVLIFSMVFLLVNGHFFFLMGIQKCFEVVPLCTFHFQSGAIAQQFSDMAGTVFVLALRLCAPVFVVLIISSLGLGVIARTVPQINIFFVGVPLKIALGFISLAIALPVLIQFFNRVVALLLQDIYRLLYLLA